MSRLRSAALVVAIAVTAPVVLFVGAGRYVQAQLPAPQGDRVRGPDGEPGPARLVGVQTAGAWGSGYAWVVPSEHGVVVIDGGLDPAGRALRAEIAQREVQGVLLTTGRLDRVAGLAALGDAPVWAHADAIAAVRGDPAGPDQGWLTRITSVVLTPPAVTGPPTALPDPPVPVTIDGETFVPIRVPGAGPGSVVWLWEGVLFTGDAVHGGSPLSVPPAGLVDDPDALRANLAALLPLDFTTIADANTGLTTAARPALFRLLGEPVAPPRDAPAGAPVAGSPGTTAVRGVVVRLPARDARGERPDLLVTPSGETWRLSPRPDPAFDPWVGQAVVVHGRPAEAGEGTGIPLAVASVAADPTPSAPASLEDRVGQVIRASGTVSAFAPLAAGATWGEGTLILAGDRGDRSPESLPFSAPIGVAIAGETITLDVRVVRDTGDRLRLVAFPPSHEAEAEREPEPDRGPAAPTTSIPSGG